jgi:D-tyrosyl-tRNA(Tyr) deacylase
MNRSLEEIGGAVLVVSQFTLAASTRRGRRPSFESAGGPELAQPLYERFVARLRERGLVVATGTFRATMEVESVNDGPVTILLDPREAISP